MTLPRSLVLFLAFCGGAALYHEQEELGRKAIGISKPGLPCKLREAVEHLALVGDRDFVPGMVEVGEL